jgi:putative membrane protein
MKLKLFVATIAIFITSWITHIGVTTDTPSGILWALLTAIVLAIINLTIKPVISIVSIPINIITLGLFSFVINGAMIILASQVVSGFNIPSLLMAIYFSLILGIVNWILHIFS